ncbi:MAG: hypothetical protein R2867_10075 [Caldilineaceae bacterium]
MQEEQRTAQEMQETLRTIDAEMAYDPHTSLLANYLNPVPKTGTVATNGTSLLTAPQATSLHATTILTDTGLDSDNDGITDFVEQRMAPMKPTSTPTTTQLPTPWKSTALSMPDKPGISIRWHSIATMIRLPTTSNGTTMVTNNPTTPTVIWCPISSMTTMMATV